VVGAAVALALALDPESSPPETGEVLWADWPLAVEVMETLSAGALAVCVSGSSVN
jgi:hypothetical protein